MYTWCPVENNGTPAMAAGPLVCPYGPGSDGRAPAPGDCFHGIITEYCDGGELFNYIVLPKESGGLQGCAFNEKQVELGREGRGDGGIGGGEGEANKSCSQWGGSR